MTRAMTLVPPTPITRVIGPAASRTTSWITSTAARTPTVISCPNGLKRSSSVSRIAVSIAPGPAIFGIAIG